MKKLCTFMLSCCLFTGCSATETPENTYVVGIDNTFAPMGFLDEQNELVGFDVEIAQAIAELNGWTLEFQNIDWDLKEQELKDGNIDFIWNGYSITEERKKEVLFSDPYMDNRQIIIVLADSPIQSKTDLADKVVSVQKNSSALEAVEADTEFTAALKDSKVIQYETNNDCFMDLEAGRSDAIVVDEVLARYMMKQKGEENYKVLEDNFGTEEYAVGLRQSDTALCEQINDGLNTLKENGTFDTIYGKWFAEN